MTDQQTVNRKARETALAVMEGLPIEPTSLVNYQSRGRVVVIGDNLAQEYAPRLHENLQPLVILTEGAEEPGVPLVPLGGRSIRIEGYLGAFKIHLGDAGKANAETVMADLVLDLSPAPLIDRAMTPPGYLSSNTDEAALSAAIDELNGMTGTFEKPTYFDYDPDICAHGRSGKTACNRCIEACPADAISGLAETIEVNAHLCQGGGACATVCPSGAIQYVYPRARDTLTRLRRLLSVYRDEGGSEPVLVIHTEQQAEAPDWLKQSHLLPFQVEELASLGLEVWLSALAYGAREIRLLDDGSLPRQVGRALNEQLVTAQEILAALGYPPQVVRLAGPEEVGIDGREPMPEISPAGFSGVGGKRQTAYLAIDHLYAMAAKARPMANLTQGAPFGNAYVEADACTLCLACVGACPGKALQSGSDGIPQLQFIEANCLQCGMCTRTCPEDAIWITPRLIFDRDKRSQPRTLHQEPPFLCVSCGKPFATRSVIDNMLNKLKGHYMFQSERALRRLTLCDECRVIDIVQDPEGIDGGMDGQIRQ